MNARVIRETFVALPYSNETLYSLPFLGYIRMTGSLGVGRKATLKSSFLSFRKISLPSRYIAFRQLQIFRQSVLARLLSLMLYCEVSRPFASPVWWRPQGSTVGVSLARRDVVPLVGVGKVPSYGFFVHPLLGLVSSVFEQFFLSFLSFSMFLHFIFGLQTLLRNLKQLSESLISAFAFQDLVESASAMIIIRPLSRSSSPQQT